VTIDHPLVTVANGVGGEQRRVGTGAGLGHREARAHLTGEQRLHPLLLLLLAPADGDQFGVARVGRLVPEDARRVHALTEDLVHQSELHLPPAAAAELRREVRGPHAASLHFLFQGGHDAGEGVAVVAPTIGERLERDDLLPHERLSPLELGLELGFGGEVPGHPAAP
jgi:hypothetical protein